VITVQSRTKGNALDNWDEIRTAYQVARAGTVSGAADTLGVHHATVIRHIDALESRLGVKLFQRHARGYTATEAGADLLQVAKVTDEQFTQLLGRIKGRGEGVSGDLVVTSLAELSIILVPVLAEFQQEHPGLRIRYLTGERVFRLEYGEAHVALRAGSQPDEPDNVVQPFMDFNVALAASKVYLDRVGRPTREADLKGHTLIGHDDDTNRAPFNRWMHEVAGRDAIAFRTTDTRATREAVLAGAGIGFVTAVDLKRHDILEQVLPQRPEWASKLWLVTHVDLHRTAKVQAFLSFLKRRVKDWDA